MYKFNKRIWLQYPSEAFDDFECIMTWEPVTIIAESNSWKTTFALDMIERNAERWVKWYYINLEFPIETMWQWRWLGFHNKDKTSLTDLNSLTDEEIAVIEKQLKGELNAFFMEERERDLIDKIIEDATALMQELDAYDESGNDLIACYYNKYKAQQPEA